MNCGFNKLQKRGFAPPKGDPPLGKPLLFLGAALRQLDVLKSVPRLVCVAPGGVYLIWPKSPPY